MPAKTILIASSTQDEVVWGPVETLLQSAGYTVVAYRSDDVAVCKRHLHYQITDTGKLIVEYDGYQLVPETIAAAWFRRPNTYGRDISDKGLQLTLDADRRHLQGALWRLIPEDRWLNSPQRIRRADYKPHQLMVAASLGFTIPKTVVSNQWEVIQAELPGEKVYKPVTPLMFIGNKPMLSFVKRYKTDRGLPKSANPFPAYWQPYIPKKQEWRVTIVGEQVFAAIVHTTNNAKDDWRLHQQIGRRVRFTAGELPSDIANKCLAYMERFNLRYGAFDFIERPDGTFVFLECNPNGQFTWLQEEIGLPINQAIAGELQHIADQQ